MSNFVIKAFTYMGMTYLSYEIFQALKQQKKLKQANKIRQNKLKYNLQLSDQKQKILAQADQYAQNHEGMRLVKRMKNQQFFEDKILQKVHQKKKTLQMNISDDDRIKLQKQINQLNQAYKVIKPKRASTLDDLR